VPAPRSAVLPGRCAARAQTRPRGRPRRKVFAADHIAALLPVPAPFAAFLGYNPIRIPPGTPVRELPIALERTCDD
jgi:hypothetical protein